MRGTLDSTGFITNAVADLHGGMIVWGRQRTTMDLFPRRVPSPRRRYAGPITGYDGTVDTPFMARFDSAGLCIWIHQLGAGDPNWGRSEFESVSNLDSSGLWVTGYFDTREGPGRQPVWQPVPLPPDTCGRVLYHVSTVTGQGSREVYYQYHS